MGKVVFWLIWVAELAAFVFVGGCFVVLIGSGSLGKSQAVELAIWTLIAITAIVSGYAFVKAVKGLQQGVEPAKLAILLAIPPLAAFVCFGSCIFVSEL